MKFYVQANSDYWVANSMKDEIIEAFQAAGHAYTSELGKAGFVLNYTDLEKPAIFHRRSHAVSIISIVTVPQGKSDLRSVCYTGLVRTLSNLLICVVNGPAPQVYFTTPECGYYSIPYRPAGIVERTMPIASAHFAIENKFSTDLPKACWGSSPAVESIKRYAKEMNKLGILPTPFPLKSVLSRENLRRVYKLYGVTGLSYGNLSVREKVAGIGSATFWMTGRGVDKAHLQRPGEDIFLVKGLDPTENSVLVSVPPVYRREARVSVDAVEHALIYQNFPEVGAIVHVHAWMSGVAKTRQNFPCGTIESAHEVVRMLKQSSHPGQDAVGLINHGLTITGRSFNGIFTRIRNELIVQVPLVA